MLGKVKGQMKHRRWIYSIVVVLVVAVLVLPGKAVAKIPLDPTTIPKYVTPLVIPPVMNDTGTPDNYSIAVRQFQQQILPGGIWDVLGNSAYGFPATTIWSYGPEGDAVPDASFLDSRISAGVAPALNSQFNYPSYTMETISGGQVDVRWINDLVDGDGNFLPHLLAVDQTLHWANPAKGTVCKDGFPGTDCMTNDSAPYTGPVPIVTHVHGAHVDPHSDGYPEAWWLPAGVDPLVYTTSGSIFDDATGTNTGDLGYADYSYRQDQPATTLWYHDHSLGMTRLNVYAGPAGFWLVRGGANDLLTGLPAPAPVAGQDVFSLNVPGDSVRNSIREIPIVIQDRSFYDDGSLFYPDNRAFFEGLTPEELQIPFVPESDIAPIWNPEAFFDTMVVNGVTWPTLEVAPALYRFRLLNGCNSRFLNLSLRKVHKKKGNKYTGNIPFFQIGAEQGFLPQVIRINKGEATPLPGGGIIPMPVPTDPNTVLLMGLAERADVIVDFRGMRNGTVIQMLNTAPDAPFGGFPDIPADPNTTGQVMRFVVNSTLASALPNPGPLGEGATDPVDRFGLPNVNAAIDPYSLVLPSEPALAGTNSPNRQVSLNEEESLNVCVTVDGFGNIVAFSGTVVPPGPNFLVDCGLAGGVPFAPKAAVLGLVDTFTNPLIPMGIPLKWTDDTGESIPVPITLTDGTTRDILVTENPTVGAVEDWDIYNFTVDAHPIHLHLVRFQVINRAPIPGVFPAPAPVPVQAWETGYKDTVIAYPGEITTIRSKFDVAGLYVWHCHIVEHEDNEMMRPYVVSP